VKGGSFFDAFIVFMSNSAIFDFRNGIGTFPCLGLFMEEGGVPVPYFKPKAA